MPEIYRAPTSTISSTGSWPSGTDYQSVDDYPDASGIDYLVHGPTSGDIWFGIAPGNLPSNATAITVYVDYYDRKNGIGGAAITAKIYVSGGGYGATGHNPTNATWVQRTDSWGVNPATGLAWTYTDVNTALTRIGFIGADVNPSVWFSSIRLRVVYTGDPPVTDVKARVSQQLAFGANQGQQLARVGAQSALIGYEGAQLARVAQQVAFAARPNQEVAARAWITQQNSLVANDGAQLARLSGQIALVARPDQEVPAQVWLTQQIVLVARTFVSDPVNYATSDDITVADTVLVQALIALDDAFAIDDALTAAVSIAVSDGVTATDAVEATVQTTITVIPLRINTLHRHATTSVRRDRFGYSGGRK